MPSIHQEFALGQLIRLAGVDPELIHGKLNRGRIAIVCGKMVSGLIPLDVVVSDAQFQNQSMAEKSKLITRLTIPEASQKDMADTWLIHVRVIVGLGLIRPDQERAI